MHAALIKEPESSDAYTQLAMAYGRKNDLADADLASAEAAFARGDNKIARELAERAKQRFPIGSPGWVRADDIVAFNKNVSEIRSRFCRDRVLPSILLFSPLCRRAQAPPGRSPW